MSMVLFYMLAAGVIGTALMIVFTPRPVHAALSFVATIFFLAGLYVMQDAHLIAALKIIVYAGAIMVLTLFVIMLLNVQEKDNEASSGPFQAYKKLFIIGIIAVFFVKFFFLYRAIPESALPGQGFGTIREVGMLLFTRYLLLFELASLILLAAIVGAVVLAGSDRSALKKVQ